MAAEYEVNIKINTQQIERELKKVDKAVNNIGKGKKGGRASGLGLMPGDELKRLQQSRIYLGQAVQGIDRLAKIQDRRARSLNKINELEAKGLSVGRLRRQLVKATTEQSRRRLGSAEKEFRVLEKSIRLEQSKLRILKEQRKGFASSPVRGTRTMMGSPAQIAAAARAGGATSPIRGGLNFPGSPAFLAGARASRTPFGPSFPTGGAFSPVRGGFNFPGSPIALAGATVSRTPFGPSFPTGGAALPVGGSTAIPGSPKAIQAAKATELRATQVQGSWSKALGQLQETAGVFKARNAQVKRSWATALGQLEETAKDISQNRATRRGKRRRERLEQVGLGAGFPLLFGGGAGSVIGGGLGGLTGSFGAQIAFSAIGQQIDQFVAGVAAVGTALTSASGTVEMFREKNLFSSDAVKKHAFELEQQGRMQELATLLAKDLASQIGTNAVKSFQDLGGEVKEFLDTVNHLFVAVGGFVAGPLAKLLDAINTVLGGVSTDIKFGSLRDSLTGEARAQFDAIVARERGTRELTGREKQNALRKGESTDPVEGKLTTAVKERVLQDPAIAALRQTINVTGQTTLDDTLGFKPKKDRAAIDAERLAKRLAGLDAERTKLEQLLQLDQQINAAKLEGDNRQIIELENQARLLEFAEKKAVIEASNVPREQKIAELRNLALERDRALLENAFRLDSFDKQKADDLTLQLDQLDLQLEAATAITREAENQAKLELLLLNLRESNKDLTEDQLEELTNKTKKLFQAQNKGPLQSFITNSVKSLNDLEQHAVQVSQGIGNAIGNSLVNGMQNLVTGAASVKEVFADMLKSVADVLAKQAAQMIATYIAIGVARIFAGMGGGGDKKELNLDLVGAYMSAEGSYTGGAFKPFKEGGVVSRPTLGMVGEGGEPEYIIPESKMRESMSRYSRGVRGPAVIPESGVSGISGEGGGTAVAAPIDVRYTVERINSVDYVTADQFQRGMRQAAAQGASQGEKRALFTLRQDTAQRKRIGL